MPRCPLSIPVSNLFPGVVRPSTEAHVASDAGHQGCTLKTQATLPNMQDALICLDVRPVPPFAIVQECLSRVGTNAQARSRRVQDPCLHLVANAAVQPESWR